MSILRKILYHTTGIAFKLSLLFLPLVFAVTIVFSSPASIEKALSESHVYDQFVSLVLENSEKQATNPATKQLLANPEVQAAIEKSFPPRLLETATTSVIQGAFAWLQGKTPEPQFTVDFSEAKTTLVSNLTAVAEKKASSLPVCTLGQAQTLDPQTDLLSLPCLPPNVNIQQLSDQFSEQLLQDVGFLDKPIITNKTLTKDGQTSLISGDAQQLPEAYQGAQGAKWAVLGLAVALAALLIFARRDRRAGVRHVSWALISVAVFWTISILAYWFMFDKFNQVGARMDSTQAILLDGAQVLLADLNRVIAMFAGGYFVLGGALLLFLRLRPTEVPIDETAAAIEPPQHAVPETTKEPLTQTEPSDKINKT